MKANHNCFRNTIYSPCVVVNISKFKKNDEKKIAIKDALLNLHDQNQVKTENKLTQKLITNDTNALKLLMTDDIYIINENDVQASAPIQAFSIEVKQESVTENPTIEFTYLGENNRYFLVLVDDKTHKELNSIHKEMLLKIMLAKGLELRDLAIVNLNQYPKVSFTDLKQFFSCNRLVLFGMDPQQIALPALKVNLPEKYMDVRILASFSLDEMSSNTDKKRQFWAVMKGF